MSNNKYVYAAIAILLVAVCFMAYWNYCSQPGTECPIPIAPTPTPTPTPPDGTPTPTPTDTPTPTPTPTPEQGELEHVRTDFSTGGPTATSERICVSDGTTVDVTEYVKAVDGDVSGTIDVKIRIDYAWSGDDEKESFSKYVEVEEGETEPIYMGSFIAEDEGSNFRQYFSKVWMDYTSGPIDLIYNPEDPDTREAVCVYPNCDPCN